MENDYMRIADLSDRKLLGCDSSPNTTLILRTRIKYYNSKKS